MTDWQQHLLGIGFEKKRNVTLKIITYAKRKYKRTDRKHFPYH